jgi:uncharacterized protein (TIGR03083 family)
MAATDLRTRPHEAEAVLATLDAVAPDALTSCPGWTVHHIAWHLTGNYNEVRRHAEAALRGDPLRRSRGFEEREPQLGSLSYAALCQRLEREEVATRATLDELVARDPDAIIDWANRRVHVTGFATHLRSEDAVHRWDIAGDDDTSNELLSQDELMRHALAFIGAPIYRRGLQAGAADHTWSAHVRVEGSDDLAIDVRDGEPSVTLAPPSGDPTVVTDRAARLLLFWGRKAQPFDRLRAIRDAPPEVGAAVEQVQRLFSGY